jgi:hypothetical protein
VTTPAVRNIYWCHENYRGKGRVVGSACKEEKGNLFLGCMLDAIYILKCIYMSVDAYINYLTICIKNGRFKSLSYIHSFSFKPQKCTPLPKSLRD